MEEKAEGLTLRDELALRAPITIEDALRVGGWGLWVNNLPSDDTTRSAVLAVWVMLRYEYADEMLHQRSSK